MPNSSTDRIRRLEAENLRLQAELDELGRAEAASPVADTGPVEQAEEARRASEERYRAVVEDQTEAICRVRADGTYVFANEVYCRFFGKAAEELIGNQWMPLCHPDDLAHVMTEVEKLSPNTPVVTIENRVYSSAGGIHWMQFVNRGFFSAAGDLVEIQSVGRDIDQRKQAEAALRDVLDQLELRVVERTEEVRRLTVEATLAEERERQAIARDLHDDLGQRLHVMRLKIDTLAKACPETAAAVDELRGLVTDASQVVRSLTSQLSPPVLKKLGLVPALAWLTEEMARQYGLTVEFAPDASRIALSPAQSAILFRSVRELLINVAKHSGVDRARLSVERHGNMLHLTVEDAGEGMADIEETIRMSHGFGLASLRERLTFLGGRLDFQIPQGGGLRVELRLPMATPEEAAP